MLGFFNSRATNNAALMNSDVVKPADFAAFSSSVFSSGVILKDCIIVPGSVITGFIPCQSYGVKTI